MGALVAAIKICGRRSDIVEMFSKVALRSGAIAQRPGLVTLAARQKASLATVKDDPRPWVAKGYPMGPYPESDATVQELVSNWKKLNAKYFGPERDLKNFPTATVPDSLPPTRMGFLPATWFEAFYNKTGVSGPYMLIWGGIAAGLSKEWITYDHNLTDLAAFTFVVMYANYKFGAKIKDSIIKDEKAFVDSRWYNRLQKAKDNTSVTIAEAEHLLKQDEGKKMLFDAKKENVGLQLEAVYRQRMADVHTAVKRRLDYQVEIINTEKRFQQEHMTNWIVDSVTAGITPQQEKESIAKCIADLKALAAKA